MRALNRLLAFALIVATVTGCSGGTRPDAARDGGDDPFIVRGQVSVGGMSGNPAPIPGPR